MEYGCIGEHLSHSFSKEIHARLADYAYDLCELPKDALPAFMTKKDFKAINVTIPYKKDVIPYLDEISPEAKAIGAVNTIVNKNGKLYGYNTDFYGIKAALGKMGFESLSGKKVLILGTGGTSRTAYAVAKDMGAKTVLRVSRTPNATDPLTTVSYEEAIAHHSDAAFIFNTTPVGMYPSIDPSPISLDAFDRLEGVFDAVYNPLRTTLVLDARSRGIAAEGGLYMLVSQAFYAVEIFLDKKLSASLLDKTFDAVRKSKENIVLIGMPSSGKSTLGAHLSEYLKRPLYDSDACIIEREKRSIPDIFESDGEAFFRDVEEKAIAALAELTGAVIATGGGAILRDANVRRLKQNGTLVLLDRSPEKLTPTADRPTANDFEAIRRRYNERYARYTAVADCHISADGTVNEVFDLIRKELSI